MAAGDTHRELFIAYNNHCESCGPPPKFTNRDQNDNRYYYGYYENNYGEQSIYVGDRQTGTAVVYMGDADWRHKYEVREVTPEAALQELTSGAPAEQKAIAQAISADRLRGAQLPNGNLLVTPKLITNMCERSWLIACWLATHREAWTPDEVPARS